MRDPFSFSGFAGIHGAAALHPLSCVATTHVANLCMKRLVPPLGFLFKRKKKLFGFF